MIVQSNRSTNEFAEHIYNGKLIGSGQKEFLGSPETNSKVIFATKSNC